MTKEELIHITLRQLSESLKTSPENFRLEDISVAPVTGNSSFPGPTIIWQFKVRVDEDKYLPDPLNSVKTIIVTYNKMAKQLQCYIYNREVNNVNHAIMAEAQAMVQYNEFFPAFFNRTYRQFMTLRQSLINRRNEKEYADYLRRLNGIFPATHEDELFR